MRKTLAAFLALLVAGALWFGAGARPGAPANAAAQTVPDASCPPTSLVTLWLGLGDQEPTDWSGSARGWISQAGASDAAGSVAWEAQSESSPLKTAGGGRAERVLPASVDLHFPGGPCGSEPGPEATIEVETPQGAFEIAPGRLAMGRPELALDGRVRIERFPADAPLAAKDVEEDFPDCAALKGGAVVCAYVEYEAGRPVDREAALAGDFGSIEFAGNGDRVMLARRVDAKWEEPVAVSGPGRDVWKPVATALSDGAAAVLWAEQREGNWDLYARRYAPESGELGAEQRLTTHAGPDFQVAASGDYLAWQARRGNDFDIYASRLGQPAVRVSFSEANDWRPSIAMDSAGAAWIAWDTYDAGNYDVYLRRFDGSRLGEPIPVAASPRFEARASVAVDGTDRVWIAFEDSDEGWGKDAGDRWLGRQATPMYVNKNILVRVWDGALRRTWNPPSAPTVDYPHDDPRIGTSQRQRISIPRMAFDGSGRPWLLFRKHPLPTGRGERWRSYGVYYGADRWSEPIPLRASDHLLDRQPGLAPVDGGLLAVYAGDKRVRHVRDREDSDLFRAVLTAGGPANEARLAPADPAEPRRIAAPVHPLESQHVARMRAERVRVGGRSLRFLRGEFHRHSEFSAHRDWDGPFEEVWRYGLDVAALDWIGPGDHDYAVGQDYLWWLQQKAADIYNAPGGFSAAYTYERSVSYPSGHRNVMLPRRGIRPLPRMQGRERVNGSEADGSPDIRNLYAYLRHFGGICSSHTSATNMGTDWRDGDREVEPVVEIFQGHRQSYEHAGAPLAATGPEDTIQGYRPLGFVWEAFAKGRRLGFQASSDHVSTHISYAIVLAEENTREGLIAAFKRRHSYAANDNIILTVRSGERLMGDEFSSEAPPRLQIFAVGTAPIDQVDIIRQVGTDRPRLVASMSPEQERIDLEWGDSAAAAGEWNMYYVRLKQRNEAMAWASPLWIRYEP